MDSMTRLTALKASVDVMLQTLGKGFGDGRLADAMRYALLGEGKRVRPLLTLSVIDHAGVDPAPFVSMACAVEMVHAYSLVHDDLPAMDDDTLRRGRPTVHVAFDEATAILAGDALLTDAFSVLSACDALDAAAKTKAVQTLALAAGSSGMVKGQMLDLWQEKTEIEAADLMHVHALKTGYLIAAAMKLGALAADMDLASWDRLGFLVGRSFQIQDDLLDAEGDETTIGKSLSDAKRKKRTMVSVHGLRKTKSVLLETFDAIDDMLDTLNVSHGVLSTLLDQLKSRQK